MIAWIYGSVSTVVGYWIWLLLIPATFGAPASLLCVGYLMEFLKTKSREDFGKFLTFAVISLPLALILALFQHDKYVTCAEKIDTGVYEQGRYYAENMRGAFDTYDCVRYRQNKELTWRVEGESYW